MKKTRAVEKGYGGVIQVMKGERTFFYCANCLGLLFEKDYSHFAPTKWVECCGQVRFGGYWRVIAGVDDIDRFIKLN